MIEDSKVLNEKNQVSGISVDISVNQIGGLATLAFLEEVDRLIGRDHIFKRSIVFVKSWCYYEGRMLGAQYGLFSTFAIEVLVLFILNHFHLALDGPLDVLHSFLKFFGTFDWDTHAVTLCGPVLLSKLPMMRVRETDKVSAKNNRLFSDDFLVELVERYRIPPGPK
jgi:hypothetical protein